MDFLDAAPGPPHDADSLKAASEEQGQDAVALAHAPMRLDRSQGVPSFQNGSHSATLSRGVVACDSAQLPDCNLA